MGSRKRSYPNYFSGGNRWNRNYFEPIDETHYEYVFHLPPPTLMTVKVKARYNKPVVHFCKNKMFMALQVNEFFDVFSQYDAIVEKIDECKKEVKRQLERMMQIDDNPSNFEQIPKSERSKKEAEEEEQEKKSVKRQGRGGKVRKLQIQDDSGDSDSDD